MPPEIQVTIMWPPEMTPEMRTSLRAVIAALGTAAEARLVAAGVPLPALEVLISNMAASDHGGSGRYDRLDPGRCRIMLAAGNLARDGLDGAVITIAHELGHMVVDLVRNWPGGAEPFEVLADSVLDEYLAERVGWALVGDVEVPSRDAVLERLRGIRAAAAERAIAAAEADPHHGNRRLVALLYHLAYARGARDAGPALAPGPVHRGRPLAAVDAALAAMGTGLGLDPAIGALRLADATAIRAAVVAMAGSALA